MKIKFNFKRHYVVKIILIAIFNFNEKMAWTMLNTVSIHWHIYSGKQLRCMFPKH